MKSENGYGLHLTTSLSRTLKQRDNGFTRHGPVL